jgi:hypothetical protein
MHQAIGSMDVSGAERKMWFKRAVLKLKLDWMKHFDDEAWLIEEAMENNDPKAGFQRMPENGRNDLWE